MSELPESDDELKVRFNHETSKISWQELQRFYARGVVIAVAREMDLIEVACQISRDNKPKIEAWLDQGSIYRMNDSQALQSHEQSAIHWAVVVAPWVIVQRVDSAIPGSD